MRRYRLVIAEFVFDPLLIFLLVAALFIWLGSGF
jgi:hypothetical protein